MKTLKTVQATAPPKSAATTAATGHVTNDAQGHGDQTANEDGAGGG